MKSTYDTEARKRPVNLTLNEDLIVQARVLTDNLSRVVESLLADYVERERSPGSCSVGAKISARKNR